MMSKLYLAILYLGFFSRLWNKIKNVFKKIVDFLKDVVDFITDLASEVLTYIFEKMIGPILENVLRPILDILITAINTALGALRDVFMRALREMLIYIVEPIVTLVMDIVDRIMALARFNVLANCLKTLDFFEDCFDTFAGISEVTYHGKKSYLLNVLFSADIINKVFWSLAIFSISLIVLFTIIALIKVMFNVNSEKSIGNILGLAVKAIGIMVVIPFFCLVIVNLSSIVLKKTAEAVEINSNGKTASLGTMTFLMFTMDLSTDPDYNPGYMTDELRSQYISGDRYFWLSGLVDFDIAKINYTIAYPTCFAMLILIIAAIIVLVRRLFELIVLYVTCPFFVSAMVLDEGAKFKTWCEMFVAKLASGYGMIIVMKLFFIITPIALSGRVVFSSSTLVNMIIECAFMIGGLWAVYKSGPLIIQLINYNVAEAESAVTSNVIGKTIELGTIAAKAAATGGSSLIKDAPLLALSAGMAVFNDVNEQEGSNKQTGSGNGFKGGNNKAQQGHTQQGHAAGPANMSGGNKVGAAKNTTAIPTKK